MSVELSKLEQFDVTQRLIQAIYEEGAIAEVDAKHERSWSVWIEALDEFYDMATFEEWRHACGLYLNDCAKWMNEWKEVRKTRNDLFKQIMDEVDDHFSQDYCFQFQAWLKKHHQKEYDRRFDEYNEYALLKDNAKGRKVLRDYLAQMKKWIEQFKLENIQADIDSHLYHLKKNLI